MGPRGPPRGRSPLRGLRPPQTARPRPADPPASGTRTPLRGSRKTTNLMPRAENNVSSSVHARQSGICGPRKRGVRAGQWLSCGFVSGRRPGSCPGDGRGPKDRPAWPPGGAERSRSAKSGGRAGPCGSAARPAPGFRDLARSAAWRGPRKHDNPRNACLRLPYATETIGVALSEEVHCISMGW